MGPQNLAYSEDFVWHMAGRLASKLNSEITSSPDSTKNHDPDRIHQLEILYHSHMVACDGPLKHLAEVLRVYTFPPDTSNQYASPLLYVGRMDYAMNPILEKWNAQEKHKILSNLKSGDYSFFPKCIDKEFLDQNPEIKKALNK
jgi:hypothetical protein